MEDFEKKLTKLNETDPYESFLTWEEDQRFILNTEKNISFDEGLEKGKKEGISQGEEKKQEEIARNMIKEGMEISLISKITGLAKEKIEAFKD